ncbi:MAG: cysteine sulfinate desulfinase [Vibrio sp. MedPE-SWchi]|nr:MAG: cysteine sulfinate desulfinase [Vibrio sp. MedPE-SWchi]
MPKTSPWRHLFPTLNQTINQKPLVYLDSAASAQTPDVVINRMTKFYQGEYATVHRGVHQLSAIATENMEKVRDQVQHFLNADLRDEIVFTKGTTEAINLVANAFLKPLLMRNKGNSPKEIIVTEMEHHANLVPWQLLAREYGLVIKIWPISTLGELHIEQLLPLISEHTAMLAVTHVSNVLGSVNPVAKITQLAHKYDIPVLVDGAQAVMHHPVDVQSIGCDFYVFSAHKLYGPTGTGVLYAKKTRLENMVPWEGGGAMIESVALPVGTTFNTAPWVFEAGTPNIAGILGLGASIDFLESQGLVSILEYEQKLMSYALEQLGTVEGVSIYGNPAVRSGVISFNLGEHHAYDVGSFLDNYGIAIRTGHHCAMPLLSALNQASICRASIGCYTDRKDIDALVAGLKRINALLG